jgi:wyosine [tRNA(Phe)-imidazoG37] synthetase (radical SAM superfamily)
MSDDPRAPHPLQVAFRHHPRQWRDFFYVYPVISRRAGGLSIGVNLNPDMACNFDCVYCCVDRTQPPRTRQVDLGVLDAELRGLLQNRDALFAEPEFRHIPAEFRRLNDIAFSGDGEPTASPLFPQAVQTVIAARRDCGATEAKIVVITDACFLTRPAVASALELLDQHNGEIWAKLDAGTEAYFRQVCRARHSLDHVLANIRAAAQVRPLVIQSLFLRLHDQPPPPEEIAAYVERLRELCAAGARLSLVQIYTVARQTAEPYATRLSADELAAIADQVRAIGLRVECYP